MAGLTSTTHPDNLRAWMRKVTASRFFFPIFLLLLCIFAYGIFLPWQSFYADDWIMLWIYQKLGAWGVNYYHITNRPFLAPLYQILLPLLGSEPWRWQLFAIIAPWLTSLSGWWLVRNLWPGRIRFGVFVSILIAVFPGYLSHAIALTTGHRNVILAIFLLSLTFTILAIRKPKYFWVFYLLSLLTSIYNMLAMEYFLFLELSRVFVIWIVLAETIIEFKPRLQKTLLLFAPFFLAFIAVLYWRVFVFPYQTFNHSLSLLDNLKLNPPNAIWSLIKQTAVFFWTAMIESWVQPVTALFKNVRLDLSTLVYLLVIFTSSTLTYLVLKFFPFNDDFKKPTDKTLGKQILLISIVPWLVGGIPFILVGLQPGIGGYESRYLLPYLLVSCLWVAFLLIVLIRKFATQIIIICVIVGLSAGIQFASSNAEPGVIVF